jgi:hypothetical protein
VPLVPLVPLGLPSASAWRSGAGSAPERRRHQTAKDPEACLGVVRSTRDLAGVPGVSVPCFVGRPATGQLRQTRCDGNASVSSCR